MNRRDKTRLPQKGALLAAVALVVSGCSQDWPAFRHNPLRTANQPNSSPLSDPAQVSRLAVRWTFTAPGNQGFRASPVIYSGRVFIGNANGRFYALNANNGAVVWQYPPAAAAPLTSQFVCNPSSQGIAASAVIAQVRGVDAIIFGAPDRSVGTGLGEGRLFALRISDGSELWKSPVIARLTGTSSGSTSQLHEQLGYSSPLVFNNRVYVGVGDHCDNPIQKGRVVAVHLSTGLIDSGFNFVSTGTTADLARGGGVWTYPSGWDRSVYVTTGNVNRHNGAPEPVPNNGLSMLRLQKDTGAVTWKFQPVPYSLDGDPDWSAGATIMSTSCGLVIISTMKDGWTHAIDSATGTRKWSFPPASIPFSAGDGTVHGDTRYMRGGAAWGDVYVAMNGGLNLTSAGADSGYRRLHAFNVCASDRDRLRWIIDVPNCSGTTYSLGHPTVTRGIFFIGTDLGHLVVIADPSISPPSGYRCSNPDVATGGCVAAGYSLVPQPAILADIALDGSMVYNEPALARGRVYVATGAGKVYMLSP